MNEAYQKEIERLHKKRRELQGPVKHHSTGFKTINEKTESLTWNGADTKRTYEQLLGREMTTEQFQHRETLYKDRIDVEVLCKAEDGSGGAFKVIGMLPEDEDVLQRTLIGRQVGSNEWWKLLEEVKQALIEVGRPPKAVINQITPPGKMTIREARIRATIA